MMRATEGDHAFTPTWVAAIDVADPSVALRAPTSPHGVPYSRARVLVMRHREPIGLLDVDLVDGEIGDAALRARVEDALAGPLAARSSVEDLGRWSGPETGAWRRVSVVLCTRDRAEQARGAIDAVLGLEHPDYELVVVDNAPSTDATERLVQRVVETAGDRVRYVREPRPGLSNARNAGLRAATGEVVAFTDDDIRVSPWWLHAVARGFAREERVACVTGSVLTATLDSPFQAFFEQSVGAATKWGFAARLFTGDRHDRSILYPYQLGVFGGGGNAAFDRAWLSSTGGFDPSLGAGTCTHGGEDLDVFLRVVTSGRFLAHEPAALVWHLHTTDAEAIRAQTFAYGVGLGAVLGKNAATRKHGPAMVRRSVAAARYLLSPTSAKNAEKEQYPLGLTMIELAGIGWGPAAYVRSRRADRRSHPDSSDRGGAPTERV